MVSARQEAAISLRRLEHPIDGEDAEPLKRVRSADPRFCASLAIGVLSSRWFVSYATPCHARGSAM
ncbi:MAG: hypothetical protein HUU21_07535 [Polyangiaceae bacterium]|nr:hypothetical protein [Polyangiaceae bacterium]